MEGALDHYLSTGVLLPEPVMCGITMQGSDLPAERSVELYVRSLLPEGYHRSQERVLDRASELVEDGTFAERHVHIWGRQAPATPDATTTTAGKHALDRITTFRAWAAVNDCSLAPAFEVSEVTNRITDDRYRVVRFPAVLMVEYLADGILCVTPHAADGEVTSVSDRLADLQTGDPAAFDPLEKGYVSESPTRSDSSRSVPDDGEHELLTTE